jgi:class 3 adenylate cyclase
MTHKMRCPACGHESPDDARFCAHCGHRLLTNAPTEERKIVSILFCDLVDSTLLGGSRDPEEWRETVRRYFDGVRAEIQRHGGTVEKFIGDAVMAVFGLPHAHEDDPERAVRAALRILQVVAGVGEIATRLGIATGEVVADPAAAEKGEFLVTGDAVNLAARLQSAASPGTILVDTRTWRNVRHVAKGAAQGSQILKGFARPVEVWEVRDAAPPAPSRGLGGLHAPLLGRDEELALLSTILQRVRRDRHSALVTIMGDAGVGKSRLFEEFVARLPPTARVLKGRSLPYGSDVAFSALADALKREAEVEDTDSHEKAREKLHHFVAAVLAEDPDAGRLTAHVMHALGLAEGDATFPITRADIFAALSRLLAAMAQANLVVIALEDVHWADDTLLDFLGELSLRPPAAQLCLICLARPLLLDRRPDWGGGRRNVALVDLHPLAEEQSRRLLRELLAVDLPDEIASPVLNRAEGNPFFVEEILRMLIAEGQLVRTDGRWTVQTTEVRIPTRCKGSSPRGSINWGSKRSGQRKMPQWWDGSFGCSRLRDSSTTGTSRSWWAD